MSAIFWTFIALVFAAALALRPASRPRNALFVALSWAATVLIWVAAIGALVAGSTTTLATGALAILPGFDFALDPLRAYFLLIAAAVYAVSLPFLVRDVGARSRVAQSLVLLFSTLLFGAMAGVLLAAGVASLLFAWEIMSLATLVFLGRDGRVEVRAGLLTLIYSEAGALAALAGLLVLAAAAGTPTLAGIAAAAPHLSPATLWAGFLLTFFGFGVKTAILPVNGWMADAYAAAPRGILPLFSGATLNLGVFTLWVVDGPLATHALWPALVVLAVGAVTAVLGITYALTENNMTRLLTRSSIENLGIIVAALGAGFAFAALAHPVLAGLALVAGLYHMLNHSTYKTLLFLGSGGIGHAVGRENLDGLGGLLRRLPLFGTVFLFGCFAIAALPPLNGFVSEWLTLQSLLRVVEVGSIPARIVFALSGALLALTAGLAVTCFAMLATATLLGLARSGRARAVHRMPASVTAPMSLLLAVCVALSLWATGIIPLLGRIAAPLIAHDATPDLVPAFFGRAAPLAQGVAQGLTELGARLGHGLLPLRGLVVLHADQGQSSVVYAMSTLLTFLVLAGLLLVVWAIASAIRRRRRVVRAIAWNAGLPRVRPEMTYTATTFAAPARVMLNAVLAPQVSREEERQGAFLIGLTHSEVHVHVIDRLLVQPLMRGTQLVARLLARMHHGPVTSYAGYIVVTLLATLLAAVGTL